MSAPSSEMEPRETADRGSLDECVAVATRDDRVRGRVDVGGWRRPSASVPRGRPGTRPGSSRSVPCTRHSRIRQNTIITGSSALVRNPLISSAMRSLTSRAEDRGSAAHAPEPVRYGRLAVGRLQFGSDLRYRADRNGVEQTGSGLVATTRARVCLARNFLSVLPRASRRRTQLGCRSITVSISGCSCCGRPRNGSRVRESPRTRAMGHHIVSEHSVRPHSQVKSTALSVSVTT
jgi:hypothetical protein